MTHPSPPQRRLEPAEVISGWYDIEFALSPTLSQRACTLAAVHSADIVAAQAAARAADGTTIARRGVAWCRVAIQNYQFLRDSGAYHHLDTPADTTLAAFVRCELDSETVRTWLATPQSQIHAVADSIGIDERFGIHSSDLSWQLPELVAAAEMADVFGLPDHGVELWSIGYLDGVSDGYLLTVNLPDGTRLASDSLNTGDLIDSELSGLDAAASVVTNTALVVNEMLDSHAAASTSVTEPRSLAQTDTLTAATALGGARNAAGTPTATAFPHRNLAASVGTAISDTRPPPAPANTPSRGRHR